MLVTQDEIIHPHQNLTIVDLLQYVEVVHPGQVQDKISFTSFIIYGYLSLNADNPRK